MRIAEAHAVIVQRVSEDGGIDPQVFGGSRKEERVRGHFLQMHGVRNMPASAGRKMFQHKLPHPVGP